MSNHAPKVDAGAKLLFILSAVALLGAVYILVISLINTYNKNSTKGELMPSSKIEKAVDNLKPIGTSSTSDAPVVVASASARSGKEVYVAVCQACHASGVAGSPKLDDKAAWEPRIATGLDALMNTAIKGKGAMPARGGNPNVSDDELKAAILYMTKEAGFDVEGGSNAPAAVSDKQEKQTTSPASKVEPVVEKKATEEKVVEVIKDEPASPKAPEAKPEPAQPVTPQEPEAPAVIAAVSTTSTNKVSLETGKKVYDTTCFACHKTGVAGSPILGNKEVWAPRIATGLESLYSAVIKGKGAMPPKGGNASVSDDHIKAAVDYMVSESK